MKKSMIILVLCVCLTYAGCGRKDADKRENGEKTEEVDEDLKSSEGTASGSSYYNKGREMSDDLADKMERIDWDDAQDKAQKAGEDLAELLNGVSDERAEQIGEDAADFLNSLFD